jgi:hypothetical protein
MYIKEYENQHEEIIGINISQIRRVPGFDSTVDFGSIEKLIIFDDRLSIISVVCHLKTI